MGVFSKLTVYYSLFIVHCSLNCCNVNDIISYFKMIFVFFLAEMKKKASGFVMGLLVSNHSISSAV